MHTLHNSSVSGSNTGKLIYGDRSQNSGSPCGPLNGKGHEEAGDVPWLDLGGSYLRGHICRNSFHTHKLCVLYWIYTSKAKGFFKKEKRILILCPTINKVTWLSLQALIQPSYLIMPQQTFPSLGKAYIWVLCILADTENHTYLREEWEGWGREILHLGSNPVPCHPAEKQYNLNKCLWVTTVTVWYNIYHTPYTRC